MLTASSAIAADATDWYWFDKAIKSKKPNELAYFISVYDCPFTEAQATERFAIAAMRSNQAHI